MTDPKYQLPTPLLRRIVANPARFRGATLVTATAFLDLKRQMGQTVRPENIPPRGGCPTAEARAARLAARITTAARRAPKRAPLICPGAKIAGERPLSATLQAKSPAGFRDLPTGDRST